MSLSYERKRHRPVINRVTLLLMKALSGDKTVATHVEEALYRQTIFEALPKDVAMRTSVRESLLSAYRSKARQLIRNIQQNATLRDGLRCGDVKPDTLVTMRAQDLNPLAPHWVAQRQRRQALQAQKEAEDAERRAECARAEEEQGSSAKETCPRCHQSNYDYYQIQTRSADEPMTVFFTCRNCGKQWKQ